jgi:hypothetical protein
MDHLPTVFAYLGPETMLPMTSVVAGVVGFLMMFGRNAWRFASAGVLRFASPSRPGPIAGRRNRQIESAGRIDENVGS